MAPPIALTLRGDGRVLVLEPVTVRAAFFRLVASNRLTYRELRVFESPGLQSPTRQTTILDRLFRRRGGPFLSPSEIAAVEQQMNRMLVEDSLALVEDEGRIHLGLTAARGVGLRYRRAPYVLCQGLLLELESLQRAELLRGRERDVVLEWADRRIEAARFLGVTTNLHQGRLLLRFAHRLDLRRRWTVAQGDFDCRRLFTIRRVAACAGFRLAGLTPLASG